MKGQKFFRLLLGLIILFSIFLFQGSENHEGCAQCEKDSPGGTLRVINNTGTSIYVYVSPLGGESGIGMGETHIFILNKGLYHVVATLIGPFSGKVVGVRMVDIKLGSDKTIRFQ